MSSHEGSVEAADTASARAVRYVILGISLGGNSVKRYYVTITSLPPFLDIRQHPDLEFLTHNSYVIEAVFRPYSNQPFSEIECSEDSAELTEYQVTAT